MLSTRDNSAFKIIFEKDNRRRCDVVEIAELLVKDAPEWAEEILAGTIIWMAKLECGHVAGPYTRTNITPLPKKMVCSKCKRKAQ